MNNTQKRILEYLGSHPARSAAELARLLNLTPANVRHHLDILAQAGQVEIASQRLASGRGRPTRLYRLSSGARAHNLAALSSALLEHALQNLDPDQREQLLKSLAQALATGGELPAGANLTRRLAGSVKQLNRSAYQARWEAHAQAPRVILAHCPYAAIIDRHPELCRMDAYLLEILLEHPVRQTARIDLAQGNPPACVFLLVKPPVR